MSNVKLLRTGAAVIGIGYMLIPQIAHACSVCVGAADSPLTVGMNAGIITLIGFTATVMTGFAAFFLRLRKRAKLLIKQDKNS